MSKEVDVSQYDIPWKQALERMFPKFIQFFFPPIFDDIDWTKPQKNLNKELPPENPDNRMGQRYVDHLLEVALKDGDKRYILIHTEIQCQRDDTINRRLQDYIARIRSTYGQWPVTLLILGDDQPNWRPGAIHFEKWSYQLSINIPTVKLLDLAGLEKDLYASDSPFALVVLAHLAAMRTKRDHDRRIRIKKKLIRLLLKKEFTAAEIHTITNFLDWAVRLPDIKNRAIWTEAKAEYRKMEYRAPIFQEEFDRGVAVGEAKGKAEGKAEGVALGEVKGEAKALIRILTKNFGPLPEHFLNQITTASQDQLERWLDNSQDEDALDLILT